MRDKGTLAKPKLRERISTRMSEMTVSVHTKTFFILVIIFLLALFLRGYYGYEPATKYGAPYLYSGGSDSYYHQRAIEYALDYHRYLNWDPMLNYPIGFPNPRAPLFDSSIAVWGEILSPFFNGDAFTSASFVLIWITALFGALTIIPAYLLAKEAFNRKVGLMAAFLLAIMPSAVERSVITNADHDSMALFFIVTAFYFFLRALKTMKDEKWVANWKAPSSVVGGMGRSLGENKRSLAYSLMSGIALAAVALIWQGYPYSIITILAYYLITILIDKFRKVDSLSVTLVTGTTLVTAFVLIYPYYCLMNRFGQWYDTPFLMFFVSICVGFAFVVTRDYPWMFVLPAGIFTGAVVLGALFVISPVFQSSLLSGQGYFFVQSKLYSTIAEAQPAQVSRMAISFGAATFLLGLWGMILVIYDSRKRITHDTIFIVSFAVVGTVLTISQGRFLFNGAPVFAILSAFVLWKILRIVKFGQISKSYEAYRGARVTGLVKSIKIKHVIGALFLAFLIVLPNVWFSLDSAIPNEEKRKYDLQVYNAMPGDVDLRFAKISFHPPKYDAINGSFWYFGAFGYSLPTPDQYWSNAYDWFSKQDNDILEQEKRPAFTSWWDYGFEAINRGDHPSVADNFQNGYQLAGSFLMAQNESEAMGFWSARLIEGSFVKNGYRGLPDNVSSVLKAYHVSPQKVEDMLKNPQAYVKVVLASPSKYGNHSEDVSPYNAKYAAIVYELVNRPVDTLANLYRALRTTTGWDVKYFAVDSRLFPFSGQNTGIFYAPAKLSDKRMKGRDRTLPYDYFVIKAVSEFGQEYDADAIPPGIRLNQQNPYKIVYNPMFYNTMLYRTFVGYGPSQVNKSSETGIPGLTSSGSFGNQPPLQAWMLSHFRVAYKTAFWNPYSPENVSKHQDAWKAISWEQGQVYKKNKNGTLIEQPDSQTYQSNGGVVFLRYYDGAYVNGSVRTTAGRVLSGVRVTISDEIGVPHYSVLTDSSGRYSILAPYGNLTLTVSTGGSLDYIRYKESVELGTATLNISVAQADRVPYDFNKDGKPDYEIAKDIIVKDSSIKGKAALDSDQVGGVGQNDTLLALTDLTLKSEHGPEYTVKTNAKGEFLFKNIAPGVYSISTKYNGHTLQEANFADLKPGDSTDKDWAVKVARVIGNLTGYSQDIKARMVLSNENGAAYADVTDKGDFNFYDVFPGIYMLTLDSRDHTVGAKRIRINGTESTSVTLTVLEGVPVKLKMKISTSTGFAPASRASVVLEDMSDRSTLVLNADANGMLEAVVPRADYSFSTSYNLGDGMFGFVKGRAVFHEYTDEVVLGPMVRVWGNVTDPNGRKVENPRVYFYRDGGYLSALGNSEGSYSIYVPRGDYVVVDQENKITEHYGKMMDITIVNSIRLDLALEKASRVQGYVYSDENSNGRIDPSEEVSFAVIEARRGPISFSRFAIANGSYEIILVRGTDYQLVVSRPGINSVTESIKLEALDASANLKRDFAVTYAPLKVKGGVTYAGIKPDKDLLLTFTKKIANATKAVNTTTKDGIYAIDLVPGNYDVKVDAEINQVASYKFSEKLDVAFSDMLFNVSLSKMVNFTFSSSGSPNNVSVLLTSGSDSYNASGPGKASTVVKAGAYNLTANSGEKIFLTRTVINETSSSVIGDLLPKVVVSGSARIGGPGKSGIPVAIRETGSGWRAGEIITSSGGSYEVSLMPGKDYNFMINHTINESRGDTTVPVEYSFQGTLTIPFTDMLTYDMRMRSRIVNVSLDVAAENMFGERIAGLPISIRGGIVDTTIVTNLLGEFRTEMPPGSYTIYASTTSHGIPQSVMRRITLAYGSNLELKPLVLGYSAAISGAITTGGSKVEAKVTVSTLDLALIEGTHSGSYRVVVPVGQYTVKGEIDRTEYGMGVKYSDTQVVNATVDSRADLKLEKETHYSVKMEWDTSQKQRLRQGERTTSPYVLTVENIGNEKDTYALSGSPSDWNYTFAPSEITLEPGNGVNKGTVFVSFGAPWDATVDHAGLVITAKSKNSDVSGTKGITADIVQKYGVKVSKKDAVFNESNASITIQVKNIGNGDDNYTFKVLNSAELKGVGWEVKFKSGNETKDSVYQEVKYSDSSQDIKLLARPIVANPKTYVSVSLQATSVKGDASDILTFELSLPDAEPIDAKVYGLSIFLIAQNWFGPLQYLIAAIPICITIIIFVHFLAKHGYRGMVIAVKRSFRPRRR